MPLHMLKTKSSSAVARKIWHTANTASIIQSDLAMDAVIEEDEVSFIKDPPS